VSNRSQAEQVIAALRGQLAHLGKAQENGAQTIAQLQRATRQAVDVGYRGVAERLHHVEQRVTKVQQMIADATRKVQESVSTADLVTDRTVPEDAAQMLAATAEKIDAAVGVMQAAHQETRRCEDEVAQALRGAQPGPSLSLLKSVRDRIAEAGGLAKTAKEHCAATSGGGEQIGSASGN